jgi:hypothetical protein
VPDVLDVHVIPLVEVIKAPLSPTATKTVPYVTDSKTEVVLSVLAVHVIASVEVAPTAKRRELPPT